MKHILNLDSPMPRLQLVIFVLSFANCWGIQPNIIFIFADDLGWNDVSFHGSKQIPTPNIDGLARDGIVLNNYYVAPLCSPSRGSLMTGKYTTRIGFQHNIMEADEPWGLPLKEKILPQYLRDLGYTTHGIGKWHLGFYKREYLPTNRGFDSYFGSWAPMGDYFTHVYKMFYRPNVSGYDFHENERIASQQYMGQYSTEVYTEKAMHIIRTHNYTQPLFLYLAHQAVHTGNDYAPFQVPTKFSDPFTYIKDEDRKKFAGMVSSLDFSVGEIFSALEDAQILNNTIVVFSSDNGGAVKGMMNGTASNFPLRGAKFTLWEGGTRGVSWMWSSELRKENRVHEGLMHITDWLPTLYAAAGGNVNELENLDGYNQWPAISRRQLPPRGDFLYNFDLIDMNAAVRKNQFKLIFGTVQNANYDWWFDKEGNNISQWNINDYFKNNPDDIKEDKNYLLHMKDSQASKILAKNYGVNALRKFSIEEEKKLLIDCRLEEQIYAESCKPTEKPCLFDLENDPCEFNNLANRLPKVVEELMGLLYSHLQNSIPPGNVPPDIAGNPKFHDNCYVPWRSMPWLSDSLLLSTDFIYILQEL